MINTDMRLKRLFDALENISDVLGENSKRADWHDRKGDPVVSFGDFNIRAVEFTDDFLIQSFDMKMTCEGVEKTAWLLMRLV